MKNLLFEEQVSPDFQVSQFFFYKFHNFHLQIISKKIFIGRTIYYIIYVLMYYCDSLFGLTKRQKEAASAFRKIETHILSQEKLNSRRV